jgi:hypothetical protein
MDPVKRLAIPMTLATLLSLGVAVPVLAAPTRNDTYADRTVIASLPFSQSLDTRRATTDADDDEINEQCGAPATDASVWYELSVTSSTFVSVDVSASNYTAGVAVATGSPGAFSVVTCGPGAVAFEASGGETYAILAFDDQGDGGGNGGTLNIVVDEAPPPPAIDVTVNSTGTFTASGSATVSGTVVCDESADFAFINVQLRQRAGRVFIDGSGGTDVFCDGTVQPWTVEVSGNGLYKGGSATATVFAIACNASGCSQDSEERSIKLQGG